MSQRSIESTARWTLKNSIESSTRRVFSHAGGVNENILVAATRRFPPQTARQWNRASCPAPG